MDAHAVALALHVVGVVLWIGGVAFVTTVLLPAVRTLKAPEERVALFEAIEARFAWQARAATLVVGGSGFYLAEAWDLWERFADPAFWWMHAMVFVWAVFTVMLFVAEPLFLHRWLQRRAERDAEGTFALIERLHRVLLAISLITVIGATIGRYGG